MEQLWTESGESLAKNKITKQIVFILSPVLLFYLMNQECYQR